ncbi:MAG: hypothetical protein MI673_04570, partial [Thiotrichales bacterium]|nr:hypothetical protein [Thiotrichales bacterium]
LLFVYKAGKVTTERMQVQNAADAVAYSVSTIEARDLNFMAYTNRAMIANEVAVAQMVGLASWLFNWKSYSAYLNAFRLYFLDPLVSAVSLGTATVPFQNAFRTATKAIFETSASAVLTFLKPIFNIGITILHNINKAFSYAQTGFHFTTILYSIGATLPDNPIMPNSILGDNAPGATISDYGIFTLLMHSLTYASLPGVASPNIPVPGAPSELWYTRTYVPGPGVLPGVRGDTDADMAGFQRFAAITNASKDAFSRQRGWNLTLPILPDGLIDFTGSDRFEGPTVLGITPWFELKLTFELDLARQGGTELRYRSTAAAAPNSKKCPPGYEPGKGPGAVPANQGTSKCTPASPNSTPTDPVKGEKYAWSAGGATGLYVTFYFYIGVGVDNIPLIGDISGKFDIGIGYPDAGGVSGSLTLDLGSVLGTWDVFDVSFPFPTSAPFSAGSAQAAKNTNKMRTQDLSLVPTSNYGGAPANRSAWVLGVPYVPSPGPTFIEPAVPVVSLTMPTTTNTVNTTYGGLPMYSDTQTDHLRLGFLAPYFISGVVKERANVNDNDGDGFPNFGDFNVMDGDQGDPLVDGYADNEVAAIAKSSVYFKRPNDLNYFARLDGQEEFGSAFNPYWQARMAETTSMDRMVALAIQQQVIGTTFPAIANLTGINFSNLNPMNWIP